MKSNKGNKPTVKLNCLVTGFNGYKPGVLNPSQLLVESLPPNLKIKDKTIKLNAVVLPGCCEAAWSKLEPYLKNKGDKQNIVIMTGLAENLNYISLEHIALNVRDYRTKDAGGHKYDGTEIVTGPLAIATDIQLFNLRQRLQQKGFPTAISHHAGTFLCNDIYYRALLFQLKNRTPDVVLFVHVPLLTRFRGAILKKGNAKTKVLASDAHTENKQVELLQLAITEVIKTSVEHLSEKFEITAVSCQ